MDNATCDAVEILFREFDDDLEILAEERINAIPLMTASTNTQKDMSASTARVSALLRQWQQEYGLPPRPDGQVHTTVAALLSQWDAEDAHLAAE